MPFDRPVVPNRRTSIHVIDATERIETSFYPQRQWVNPRAVNYSAVGTLGTANGTITPRSGNAAGTGKLDLWTSSNGTLKQQLNANNSVITITVYNMSSTNGGIPNGTWCITEVVSGGDIFVWSVDCGN